MTNVDRRAEIFKHIDALQHVVHILEATANTYYSPDDKMWNVLLKARDKINEPINKEVMRLYDEADKLNKEGN